MEQLPVQVRTSLIRDFLFRQFFRKHDMYLRIKKQYSPYLYAPLNKYIYYTWDDDEYCRLLI